MLVQGKRPRELHWYHAGPMLFGDWGTSRLYVLGLCFFYMRHASIWFMAAMSALLHGVGWAYQVICRLYPDGGGVYSSARHRSQMLAVVGALLLCADYIVTTAISALDAFDYMGVADAHIWAAVSIAMIGLVNYFGPRSSGTGALVVALLTVVLTLVIAIAAFPSLGEARTTPPEGTPVRWWRQFTFIILAISGVEAVANMTGIMVEPVAKTSRRAILPVVLEIVILNMVMTLAMQAIPSSLLERWGADKAAEMGEAKIAAVAAEQGKTVEEVRANLPYEAHRDDMLGALAEHYVGKVFAVIASFVFALLLLSAVNTAVTDLVSIQYMMSRDRELPPLFALLNRWGMPAAPLVIAALVPLLVLLAVPDVAELADLYAIGVIGAVAINLGASSTDFHLPMARWERAGMMCLAALMLRIWFTIASEKPFALMFALAIMALGLIGRGVARNWGAIRAWMLAPGPHPFGFPTPSPAPGAVGTLTSSGRILIAETPKSVVAAYAPTGRIMVATRGNPKLLHFALEQAKARQAALLVLFVRHIAVPTMGPANVADAGTDPEAQTVLADAKRAADEAGVPVQMLYAVTGDIAEAILDLAVTHGVDTLILGATQRGTLWRTMKGDILQNVAQYLPERTNLVIHA